MSLAAAVGAPAPVTIGEREYMASPVNLYELGAIEERTAGKIIANAAASAVHLSPDLWDKVMADAHRRALKISYYSPEFTTFLGSFNGTCGMIVHSLRRLNKNVDEAEIVRALAKDPKRFAAVAETVMRISGLAGDDAGGEKGGDDPGEARGGESGTSSPS